MFKYWVYIGISWIKMRWSMILKFWLDLKKGIFELYQHNFRTCMDSPCFQHFFLHIAYFSNLLSVSEWNFFTKLLLMSFKFWWNQTPYCMHLCIIFPTKYILIELKNKQNPYWRVVPFSGVFVGGEGEVGGLAGFLN